MNKKALALLIPAALLSFSTITFADYCPPASALHCTNGSCTLDSPYDSQWSMSVVGKPTGYVFFGGAALQNPPNSVDCMIGSSRGNYVDLYSKVNYSPDLKDPRSAWVQYPGNMYVCNTMTSESCPLKSN